jgi:hypothetical protein
VILCRKFGIFIQEKYIHGTKVVKIFGLQKKNEEKKRVVSNFGEE